MHFSYLNVFKEAWQIALKNKVLWFFGIFASFISLESAYEIILGQINQAQNIENLQQQILNLTKTQADYINLHVYFLNQLPQDYRAYTVFLILLALIAVFTWIVFASQIFIIKFAALSYHKKLLVKKNILEDSLTNFWSVLGINVLFKIILYAGYIALSLPLLYLLFTNQQPYLIIANVFFIVAFAVFAVSLSFLTAYATNFIVLKKFHLIEAIKAGWQLFSKNIIVSLEAAFLLFFLKILSIIIIFCILFLLIAPIVLVFSFSIAQSTDLMLLSAFALILIAFTIISLIINSVFTVFYLSSWTIIFIKLTEESIFGKIILFINGIPKMINDFTASYRLKIDKDKLNKAKKQIKQEIVKDAKIIGQELEKNYQKLKPRAKEQGKILAKNLLVLGSQLQAKIKKEIKKRIKSQQFKSAKKPLSKQTKRKK